MSKLDILGFGSCPQNGPFMLDGHCDIVPPNELSEKEGLKLNQDQIQNQTEPMFMKLKIGKVVMYKKYY